MGRDGGIECRGSQDRSGSISFAALRAAASFHVRAARAAGAGAFEDRIPSFARPGEPRSPPVGPSHLALASEKVVSLAVELPAGGPGGVRPSRLAPASAEQRQ
jgi:hypothetical protein